MLKLLLGNPYVFGGIALAFVLMGAGLWVENGLRIAAEKGEKAAQLESGLHAADADRWQLRSKQGDDALDQVVEAYKRQTENVEAGRAKEAELGKSLRDAAQQRDVLQSQADQLSRDLEAEAEKAPADVRVIGPIVSRRVKQLFE